MVANLDGTDKKAYDCNKQVVYGVIGTGCRMAEFPEASSKIYVLLPQILNTTSVRSVSSSYKFLNELIFYDYI